MNSQQLLRRLSLLLVVVGAVVFCSLSAVRSDPGFPSSALRLPSEKDESKDICYGSPQPMSCPINCFRTDPVCGSDGVTYWCGCADAACAGVRVAKQGFCEVGNGGSGPVSGQALLLVHIVWLIVLGFSVLFGIF
ncbi:uncharacterized protein LOC116195698 [Punica granatum]|uniref:Uncharacterized protein n=2 Tax=Punica granatum TaxID=22663 RepID=A0A2I0HV84_PUNGR|nr:uncharacterized protein LOC116195698 [Punica granatum]PKI35615.1 hypothetical protein CRG98_044069 [Punica granatum]